MNTPRKKQDRIDRAASLVPSVIKLTNGTWCVRSSKDSSVGYCVTREACPCFDSERRGFICKHRLAAVAPVIVEMIMRFRQAQTPVELLSIAHEYKTKIAAANIPPDILALARTELKSQSRSLGATVHIH